MRRISSTTHRSMSAPDLRPADAVLVLAAASVLSVLVGAWISQVGLDGVLDPHSVLIGTRLISTGPLAAPVGVDRMVLELSMAALVAALWSVAVLVPRRPELLRLPR
jgi:hypothetical protein